MLKVVVTVLALIVITSCTDAKVAKLKAYGSSGKITCYSGGKVIYTGVSTGKIGTEEGSDGWYFMEQGTDSLVRVSGDCVIKN